MDKNNLAPIVVFAYRRLDIKNLLDSLLKNNLSKDSVLIIFSDGSKNKDDLNDVNLVRQYLTTIKGFKSIEVVESDINKGLANSVIDGVTKIINRYGRIIVLEDDLIVSNNFLSYINEALCFYRSNEKIWSVTGYGPNLPDLDTYEQDVYLSVRASSWSWATWKDRWNKIDWEIKDFDDLKNDAKLKKKFNSGGNDLYKMLELQMLGKIDSWAIRWTYNQFKYGMYTIYPKKSQISNNGFSDGVGIHNNTKNDKWVVNIDDKKICFYDVKIDNNIAEKFKQFYNLGVKTEIGYFFKKYGMYNVAKSLYKEVREKLSQ